MHDTKQLSSEVHIYTSKIKNILWSRRQLSNARTEIRQSYRHTNGSSIIVRQRGIALAINAANTLQCVAAVTNGIAVAGED